MNALILAAQDDFALNILRCLMTPGTKIHVLGAGNLRGVSLSRHCARYVRCDRRDFVEPTKEFVSKIIGYCKEQKIDIVLSADALSTLLLSKIKSRLAPVVDVFPVADAETLQFLHHKWSFAEWLKTCGIPAPRTMLVETVGAWESQDIVFPVIVKPPAAGNRIGVRRLDSRPQLSRHIAAAAEAGGLPLLIQEYIPGEDVDLSVLAEDGRVLAWTIQRWLSDGCLEFIRHDGVLEIGRKIVSSLRYSGVAHFDMRIDSRDGAVKPIECNPRFWGTLRASVHSGVNFVRLGVLRAQKRELPESPYKNITYMLPSKILPALLRGEWSVLRNISPATVRDVLRIAADPVSCFYMLGAKLRRKG